MKDLIFTMKYILVITLSIKALLGFSQNCNVVNDFTSFRGLKFGSTIPDSIRAVAFELKNKNYTKTFLLNIDEKNCSQSFKKLLKSWLWFNGQFSDLNIYCLNNNKIYKFVLMKGFDSRDSTQLANRQYPQFYEEVSAELLRLFGDTKEVMRKNDRIGNSIARTWDCQKIQVELSFCPACLDGFFYLSVTDKELEAKSELEHYKN